MNKMTQSMIPFGPHNIGEGPTAEPRHESFSLEFLQFCCAESWEFRAEVFAEVSFALIRREKNR